MSDADWLDLIHGDADILASDGDFYLPQRFLDQQVSAISKVAKYSAFARHTAGITLAFRTNSDEFAFECAIEPKLSLIRTLAAMATDALPQLSQMRTRRGNRRRYNIGAMISMDVFEMKVDDAPPIRVKANNDLMVFRLDNPDHREVDVRLYFPILESPKIRYFAASGDIEPIRQPDRRMLFLGDSITQGCYTASPSSTYVSQLARELGYEALNQGIAGCTYDARFLDGLSNLERIDQIMVAYGTNDWAGGQSAAQIQQAASDYYDTLTKALPNTPITVLSPIWRGDMDNPEAVFPFEQLDGIIRQAVSDWPDILVINGLDVSAHDSSCYSDQFLHPNASGFEFMAERLTEAFKASGRTNN